MPRELMRRSRNPSIPRRTIEDSTTMIWILYIGYLIGAVLAQTEVAVDMTSIEGFTEMRPGEAASMDFSVTFPDGVDTTDSKIELLVSLTELVFALGDTITCAAGSSLTISNTSYCTGIERHLAPNYEETDSLRYYHRAVINLGTVTSAVGGTIATNTLVISFEAVYITPGSNALDSEYAISAGVEYDSGSYIWIAQVLVTLKDLNTADLGQPTFSVESIGDTTITDDGEVQLVEMTVGLPYPVANMTVEVVSLNDTNCALVVEKLSMKTAGAAFAYQLDPSMIAIDAIDQCCPTSLSLPIGRIVNKDSQKSSPNVTSNNLVFQADVMLANSSIPAGEKVTLGFAVLLDSTEIWISSSDFLTGDGTFGTTTFTSEIHNGSSSIAPAFPGGVILTISVPAGAAEYTVEISTAVLSASTNGLSILAVNILSTGNNIPCNPTDFMVVNMTEPASDQPGLIQNAKVTIPISNYGLQDAPTSNDVEMSIYFQMMAHVNTGETFTASVDVNGLGPQDHTFSVGNPAEYDTDLVYNFDVQHGCGTNAYQTGSVVKFIMTITTQRGAIAGPATLELPIPEDLANSLLTFKSAEVTYVGTNVVCVNPGPLNVTLSDWSGSPNGTNDRAVAYIPLLCNYQLVDSVDGDKLIIEMKVQIKNDPSLMNASGVTNFALGMQYTTTQIFAATCPFDHTFPTDFVDVKYVLGFTLPADVEWAEDAQIQWSRNNSNYHVFVAVFKPYSVIPGLATNIYLETPLFTRYLRIVNTDGGCSFSFTPITEAINMEFHGDAALTPELQKNVMFAFDNDVKTCMDLPTIASVLTPQYFMLNIPATLPYLNVNSTGPFSVHVIGQGLSANTPGGPQVTKLSHPKDASTLKFTGRRRKCKLTEGPTPVVDSYSDQVELTYLCSCSDETTCADVNLMLMHVDSNPGNYTLCDIRAEQ